MGVEAVSAYRAFLDAIGFCLVLVGGVEAFYSGKPWWVYLPYLLAGLVFFVLGEKGPKIKAIIMDSGPWGRLRREIEKTKPSPLEIRPAPGESVKSFVEKGHGETHFRMEVYNPPTEIPHSVQVKLVGIEPHPICEHFRGRADFPYFVRPAHLADGSLDSSTDHVINPGTSRHFELLYFWESSDHRIMVDGIDTKQALGRDARFSIEDKECWHLNTKLVLLRMAYRGRSFSCNARG